MSHEAMFYGKVIKKIPKVYDMPEYIGFHKFVYEPHLGSYDETEYDAISLTEGIRTYKTEIPIKPYKIGEKVFINRLQEKFEIVDIAKSDDGTFVYYLDYIIGTIEDKDEMRKAKEEYNSKMLEYEKKKDKILAQERVSETEEKSLWEKIAGIFK